MPLRMFASIVLGRNASQAAAASTAYPVGLTTHSALSALFGLVYAAINARFSVGTQTRWSNQAGLGLLFGVVLWAVTFHLIACVAYPRFLTTPQLLQMSMHALFFGLPLGLLYAAAERRVHHIGGLARPV